VLLFIPSLALVRFDEKIIAAFALAPIIAYLALFYALSLPDFSGHYLGGFGAAPFYLPIMLAGVITGKRIDDTGALLPLSAIAVIIAIILALLVPPYKALASPSFMALSIFASLALFSLLRKVESEPLEYLGRDPLRFWILMFLALIIPLGFYFFMTKTDNLGLDWPAALALSAGAVLALYALSKAIDCVASLTPRIRIS